MEDVISVEAFILRLAIMTNSVSNRELQKRKNAPATFTENVVDWTIAGRVERETGDDLGTIMERMKNASASNTVPSKSPIAVRYGIAELSGSDPRRHSKWTSQLAIYNSRITWTYHQHQMITPSVVSIFLPNLPAWCYAQTRCLLLKVVRPSVCHNIDAIDQWHVTLSVCEGQGTLLWASSALKPALFRATHDFQKKPACAIFHMQSERR